MYIGQTKQTLEQRFKKHITLHLNDNTLLHNKMKEIGVENFWIELIEKVKDIDADQKELQWILFYYNRGISYNTKITSGKCGGNTYKNNKNMDEIRRKISESKRANKNPNSVKVIAENILTLHELKFNYMIECQNKLNIKRHDIISRRCRGKIKKAYNNEWNFRYDN